MNILRTKTYVIMFIIGTILLSSILAWHVAAAPAPITPWQTAAGTLSLESSTYPHDYAMGYHFTPLTDGYIIKLGGFFDGTKTVRLFNTDTGALLAETTVTANNDWGYTAIEPVSVEENVQYTVAVYFAGLGGSSERINMPIISGDIRIDASTYISTESNPDARPTRNATTRMYGYADVEFIPAPPPPPATYPWQAAAGSSTFDNDSPQPNNYAMGYNFTPLTDGSITKLGGSFNGTKTVRLFNTDTRELLAETTVTANNDWSYTAIDPVLVEENVQYTILVYFAGSGGNSTRVNMPFTSGGIRIDTGATIYTTERDPLGWPTYDLTTTWTSTIFGQADVEFTPAPMPLTAVTVDDVDMVLMPYTNIFYLSGSGLEFVPQAVEFSMLETGSSDNRLQCEAVINQVLDGEGLILDFNDCLNGDYDSDPCEQCSFTTTLWLSEQPILLEAGQSLEPGESLGGGESKILEFTLEFWGGEGKYTLGG